jgi:23S rRNA pseudouridine2604 synthase
MSMATLKLKKPARPDQAAPRPERAPARGQGSAPRKRPTLAEAQAQRAEREARYQEQLRQRFGDKPPPAFQRRDERDERGPQDARRGRSSGPMPQRGTNVPQPRRRDIDERQPARSDATRTRNSGSAPNTAFGQNKAFDANRARPSHRSDEAAPAPQTRSTPRQAPHPSPHPSPHAAHDRPRPTPDTRRPRPVRPSPHDDDEPMQREHPEVPGSMRLSKRMSELGIASRREADEWIAKGWVRVDDQIVNELGSRVMPDQRITIDAKAKFQQAQKVTVLLNKPVGYVSGQAEDGYEPAIVLVTPQNQWREDRSGIRFLRDHLRNLAPAGRLDIDSVGLLVLTQDGRIARQLIGEDSDIEKEYLVRVQMLDGRRLPDDKLALLRHGLELDGEPLREAQVEWINEDQLRFVLKEGKKRQIRRMCEAVGLKVLGLKRVRTGGVMLGDLPPGAWRYLRLDERFG